MRDSTIYQRMAGYVFTIIMHLGNIIMMNYGIKDGLERDPVLRAFGRLQPRYFTCWTFGVQIIHACVGLICDCLTLKNSKDRHYRLPKHLQGFKNTLFSAVLWPSTWVVFTVFWSLYIYDRRLIYPEVIDKVVTSTSNHIMHTAIVPVVLWEVLFRQRTEPKSHRRNLAFMTFHFLLYIITITLTYIEYGTWLYPILTDNYGTVYFPLFYAVVGVFTVYVYYAQWTLNNYLWKGRKSAKKTR